jgi:nucleotide-binding universal stress UspA family protein
MTRIIVGVDESDGAAESLRWAVQESKLRSGHVTAVLAWGYLDQHHLSPRFDAEYSEKDALDVLGKVVANAVGDEPAASVELRAVCDLPARALLEASRDADLLVVGARGLGGFRGLLLGSVSQHCLHHTTCPIAVVRPRAAPSTDGRIVVAVDGSETARGALRWALDEGRARTSPVEVVHAWTPPYVAAYPHAASVFEPGGADRAAHELLDEVIGAEDTTGLESVRPVARVGGAAQVLLEQAQDAELVVLGSRGLGGFAGLLLGSVTSQVTRHAPCPVVVVPAARAAD